MQQKFYFIVNSSKAGYGVIRSSLLTSYEQAKEALNEFFDNYKSHLSLNTFGTIDARYPMKDVQHASHLLEPDEIKDTLFVRSLSFRNGTPKRNTITRIIGQVKIINQ